MKKLFQFVMIFTTFFSSSVYAKDVEITSSVNPKGLQYEITLVGLDKVIMIEKSTGCVWIGEITSNPAKLQWWVRPAHTPEALCVNLVPPR